MAVSGLSIGPMCILVKDHSRGLCEQLQQLRLQTGLVDLDIVCEVSCYKSGTFRISF